MRTYHSTHPSPLRRVGPGRAIRDRRGNPRAQIVRWVEMDYFFPTRVLELRQLLSRTSAHVHASLPICYQALPGKAEIVFSHNTAILTARNIRLFEAFLASCGYGLSLS